MDLAALQEIADAEGWEVINREGTPTVVATRADRPS